MPDILVRRNATPGTTNTALRNLEPLQTLRELLRWDPFQEMSPAWFDRGTTTFMPSFEVKETKDAYLFKADVPGVKENDVEVTVTGNRLTVAGHREEEKEDRNETYYACERTYGSFTRSFTLPEGANTEQIHADLKSGVLTVAVSKQPQVQPKKIAVKSEKAIKA